MKYRQPGGQDWEDGYSGDFTWEVRPEESMWTLNPGQHVHVSWSIILYRPRDVHDMAVPWHELLLYPMLLFSLFAVLSIDRCCGGIGRMVCSILQLIVDSVD